MYLVHIHDWNEPMYGIILKFTSQTEILDFVSLLHLSQNSDIVIQIRYEEEQNK